VQGSNKKHHNPKHESYKHNCKPYKANIEHTKTGKDKSSGIYANIPLSAIAGTNRKKVPASI
jgi:hypothetical protein